MSKRQTLIILGMISLILMLVIGGAIWWFLIRTPAPPKCTPPSDNLTCLTTGNLAAIEDKFDSKIPTPSTTLKVTNFGAAGGAPWCISTYYALRYVDGSGKFGDLGDWSSEVIATKKSSPGGCEANLPKLEPKKSVLSGYNINIHRQQDKLNKSDEGEIIGMLSDNFFIDANNPNSDFIKSICKGCK